MECLHWENEKKVHKFEFDANNEFNKDNVYHSVGYSNNSIYI